MKLTKSKLKQIIQEEIKIINENIGDIEEDLEYKIKKNIAELVDNFKRYAEERGRSAQHLWSYIDERVKQINPNPR